LSQLNCHHFFRAKDIIVFVKKTFINNIMMFSKNDLPFPTEMISDDFFEPGATE
jgi:hypothetical protein